MKTKLFTLFVALYATTCLWAYDFQSGDLYYNITSSSEPYTIEVTSGSSGYSGSVTIPETVTYDGTTYSVTSIGARAFEGCSGLTSITIPNSVTSIGYRAFRGCSGLTSITIGNSVTSIGDYAFSSCSSLASVTIGNSVTSIGEGVFSYCSGLTSITIPNSVTSIRAFAFYECFALTTVTIGNSVTSIGSSAFYSCQSLTSITIGNSVTSIGEGVFAYCYSLTSVTIPNSVTSIGRSAFYSCQSLTSITIGNSVTSIGEGVFYECFALTSVTIPNSVTSIGSSAFYSCESLTSITIGNSVTSIGDYAFQGCSGLTSVVWNVENYGNFSYSSNALFYDFRSQITSFTFGDGVQHIPAFLCDGMNKLTSITIPNSVTSIGDRAFNQCSSLTEITIPNSVTSIGEGVFSYCSGLREISLGSGLQNIGSNAFAGCPRIYEVTCLAQEPPVAELSSFTNYDAYFHAPCDAQRYYSVDPIWKNFHNVECIVTENTVMDDITITPSDCEATVVWLSHEQAATYSLVIYKSGETYCTLTFNKYGQLINIALAPARVRAKQDAAAYTETGYSFTITGLEAGTTYDYAFAIFNDAHNTIDQHFGHFTTTQEVPTELSDIQAPTTNTQKIIRDGQIIILRDGVEYNALGQIINK